MSSDFDEQNPDCFFYEQPISSRMEMFHSELQALDCDLTLM
jgi:hypothetical protein